MTVWRHNISWSKMKAALECPYRLQLIIDKVRATDVGPNYYQELGHVVQYAFEMYFNQGINLKGPNARTEAVIGRVADKILESNWFKSRAITFPNMKSIDNFRDEAKECILQGRKALIAAGVYDKPMKSELKLIGRFRDLGLFGQVDFYYQVGRAVAIFDGKAYKEKNADPRQVVHYGLAAASSGLQLLPSGLIYYRHGEFVPVDVSPTAIKHYIDTDLEAVKPIFTKLKEGTTEDLEARPSNENCFRCMFKRGCKYSAHYTELPDVMDSGDISLHSTDDGMITL